MDFSRLPPKSEVGVLAPEIAGEGERVIHSDGEQVNWTPPVPRPVMPDMSQVKSLARYFGRTGHQVWPAWVYHPTEQPRLLRNAEEGKVLGIWFRKTTDEERARYGRTDMWDWEAGCEWRPNPMSGTFKFDPKRPGTGKTYLAEAPNPGVAQNALIEAIIPQVAAAVAQALKMGGPSAPADVKPADWAAFQEFLAWKKSAEGVKAFVEEPDAEESLKAPSPSNALAAVSTEEERTLWAAEAERKGIKVDGRWSLERLKSEVEKAA